MKILNEKIRPFVGLTINVAFGIVHCTVGFLYQSWWFITLGAYYSVLAANRFTVLGIQIKTKNEESVGTLVKKVTGVFLLILSFCMVGINVLSIIYERGTKFHEIIMITVATYTFAKITLAIVGLIRSGKISSPFVKTLRSISFAEAVVSVYTLQRSMLVTFPGMAAEDIVLMNIATGTVTWIIVLILGLSLITKRHSNS